MCNLYRMTKGTQEVARWFDVEELAPGANFGSEVYPGFPGVVIADGGAQVMTWGFPLLRTGIMGQVLKPKPVNNARADKLDTGFWSDSFFRRRCLIPLTAWAEAEGERGRMTRTWFARADAELFAVAGIWRMSAEWGAVYAMVMTDSCGAAVECHTRMPVILREADYTRWTGPDPEAALALCAPYDGPLIMDCTAEPWAGAAAKPATSASTAPPDQPSLF